MKKINQTFLLLSAFLFVLSAGCDQSKDSRDAGKTGSGIEIVTHRGANREAPENTYASALRAIECGAAYVEIDVRRSSDGVYYIIHDRTLDRTTNGIGPVSEASSGYIDQLDAGSWFGHEFAGERVPRLYEFLQWIQGKAKVYFDVKDGDLGEIIAMVYETGLENDCFFWFGNPDMAREFRALDSNLWLKVNASSIGQLDSLVELYNPQIIERGIVGLTGEFIDACHERGLKVMANFSGDDRDGYRKAISLNPDMVNVDNPCVFSNMVANNGEFTDYKLIAHRGGITGGIYNEFDPASVQKAIDVGYYMLEVDVRQTKDGVLIVHHDRDFSRFFNDPRRVGEMTWEEIQTLRSDQGDYHPMSFEQLAEMCSGKIKLMMDLKDRHLGPEYFHRVREIMEKYDLLRGSYFIDYPAREYFWGEAKLYFRVNEIPEMMEKIAEGEDVACHYFLFDHGNRLNSEAIKWAQRNYITVVPSVNVQHYRFENHWQGAKRDIEFLKECGVIEFQIDSHYDQWLNMSY